MQQVVLFYNYTKIEDPQKEMERQRLLMEKFNLKCRMIIAHEGINGNFEGLIEDTEKYIEEMMKDERFNDTHWKRSMGDGTAFPKISIKVRDEILSHDLGDDDFDPNKISGDYMTAEQLHELYEKGEEFYIIDMRNDFEHRVGYFKDSVKLPLKSMRQLSDNLDRLDHLKNKKVITVCTGGVKCEKASGVLVKNGFRDVYQLHGGIHDYIEKYPNQNFRGKLYVYDQRIVMGFELDSDEHVVVSSCDKCGASSDNYINCNYKHCPDHTHFICCDDCVESRNIYCSNECKTMAIETKKFLHVKSERGL